MPDESLAHKSERVRRPRVHIVYDVHTGGALKKVELPFVVAVLADLSGDRLEGQLAGENGEPLEVKDRKFVDIHQENFNAVMGKSQVRAAFAVDDKLTDGGGMLPVELNFKTMADFTPARVAAQVEPLKKLLDMRNNLTQLLNKMEGNDKLQKMLADILGNTEKAMAAAQELGVGPAKEGA